MVRPVPGCTAHPHADLTAGVATEDRAVVDQGDVLAEPRGGDRGADTGEATADDGDVGVDGLETHG